MNRAGLLNFWYYDEEVFDFSDGKLLLRGSNGSGKSVTMQSFLPVLLDGKKSPDRLDPFGSRARRMEDYLLGEKEIVNRDERTGYLFLEFKRQDTEQYTTIGIGLQAKRNKQMKFWGFVITDNRRIGYDLELYKYEQHAGEKQKIPCSRIELENRLGEGGQVVQTQTDYMKLVNKYIFGFETIEAYEDLIKLLIQLRSPKLSKDFRPTVIYEILEAALPPLTDDDLRHLSDTIEQMDQTKQQIEQLEREVQAITSLNQVYTTYNSRIIADQANELINATKRVNKEEKAHEQLLQEKGQLETDIATLNQAILELKQQQETNEKQKERLQQHKVWNLQKELNEAKQSWNEQSRDLNRKQKQLEERRQRENNLMQTKIALEADMEARLQTIKDTCIDLDNDAEEASFTNHTMNKQDFDRHQHEAFNFSLWIKETQQHTSTLEQIASDFRTFEDLKQKYQEKDKELAGEQKQFDDAAHQEQAWVQLFEEDKQQKLNDMYNWVQQSDWLTPGEAAFQEASRAIHSLYEPTPYELVRAPFREAVFQYEQQQRQKLSELTFAKNQLGEQLTDKQTELQEWKDKKDPEPATDPLTKEARAKLRAANVSHVPFYAAIEFHDHVESDVRKRIEAAMIDSGMLDALITGEKVEIEHDRVLVAEPNIMGYTLADFLRPDLDSDHPIAASSVDDVLRSIVIAEAEPSTFSVSEDGHYQLGLLKGHAVPVDDVRYIGRTARKRFRQAQIDRIQEELFDLQEQKRDITVQIEAVEASIAEARTKLGQFPDDQDLQENFKQISESRLKMKHHKERMQVLSEQLKTIHDDYSRVKSVIDKQTRLFNIEVNRAAYEEAITVIKRYDKDLSRVEKEHIKYVHIIERQTDIATQLQDLVDLMDELKGEINIAEDQTERLQQNIAQIETQLEAEGVTDIRQQIANVQQALQEIHASLDAKKTTLPRKESDKQHLLGDIQSKQKQVEFWKNMKQAWAQTFEQELNRGYVNADVDDKEFVVVAGNIVSAHGLLLKEKDASKLAGQLTSEYYKQQSDLMEYRMSTYDAVASLPEWMNSITDEEQQPHIEQWKQKASRRVIELDYQGKQVSPYTVQQQIADEQARQESLLDDQDQALYEEILFKSVGQKLRARIRRAEQWAKKMDTLMSTRDTSSGLSFSIRWKPRTADSEAELDTVDLVQLLKQDARLLKEEDLERITVHFRSKIAKAKELMGNNTEIQTLLQVLKEVLDYRKWFSFVLYFQREGESKRELTNNQFYKFSGGEKAMAMYIPLFTACYSRYLEADEQAPYIISLDEAFAGVDENNIREMFEIVEHLGFDYIMNSQVLWGDYDTISQLSVCELVRPKNADFVSVIRYYWDGKQLDLQLPESEEQDIEDETYV